MSDLGFRSYAAPGVAKRMVTAESLHRGPPNPRMDAFMAEQRRKKEEMDAADRLRQDTMAPTTTTTTTSYTPQPRTTVQPAARTNQPGARVPQRAAPQMARAPAGGIESSIKAAADMAADALARANALHSETDTRLSGNEQLVAGLQAQLRDLQHEVARLHDAARDAWMATFVMHAEAVGHVAITDSIPPDGAILTQVQPGERLVCVGEMVDCSSGVAIQARTVHPTTGQIIVGYVLVRDTDGNEYVSNFHV